MQPVFMQTRNRLFHAGHGRRHQRGKADDLRTVLPNCLDHALRRYVSPQIDNSKTVVFQHGSDDVFSDIVNVAFHRGQHNRAFPFARRAALPDDPAHLVKRRAGGGRRIHKLRQKDDLLFVLFAHRVERRNQLLFHHVERRRGFQQLSRRCGGFVAKPLGDCIRNRELHAGFLLRLRLGLRRVALDIGRAVRIFSAEHPAGVYRVHHFLLIGVDDGQRQAALNGLRQKCLCNQRPLRQTERNVGYAEHRFKPQFTANPCNGFKRLLHLILLRGNRQRQAVNRHIFPRNARFERRVQNRARKTHARLAGRRQSIFAQRESNDRRAVFFCNRKHRFQRRAGCVYAVDHALSRRGTQTRFNHLRARGINL